MMLIRLFLLLLTISVFASCGDSIDYPSTFTFDSIEIVQTRTVRGGSEDSVVEIEPSSQQFTDPLFILENFGAPSQVASITLVSETELTLTSTDGQEASMTYDKMGDLLIGFPFNLFLTSDNDLKVSGCLTVISSPSTGFKVNADFCTFANNIDPMEVIFAENNLIEGDTLGYTNFEAYYR